MFKKYIVTLTAQERTELNEVISKGKNAAKIRRANLLLCVDEADGGRHMIDAEVSKAYGITTKTVERLRRRFVEEGFDVALKGKRKGTAFPRTIDGDVEAKIIALTRISREDGTADWTYQAIADQMVELGYIESISHESVRKVLKKTRLSHTSGYAG